MTLFKVYIIIYLTSIAFTQGMLDNIDYHKSNLLKTNNDSLKLNILIHLSWDYRVVNIDSAFSYSNKAIELADLINHDSLKAKALSINASLLNSIASYDSALIVQKNALSLRNRLDYLGRIYSHTEIARYNQNLKRFRLTKYNYEKALSLLDTIISKRGFDNITSFYEYYFSNYEEYYNKELYSDTENSITGKINNKEYSLFNRIIVQYSNIQLQLGGLNLEIDNPVTALTYFQNVAKFAQNLNTEKLHKYDYIIYSYYGLAKGYYRLNLIDSSDKYLEKTIRFSKLRPDSISLAKSLLLKGKIYLENEKYSQAIESINTSLSIFERKKHYLASEAIILKLRALLDSGNYDKEYLNNELDQLDYFSQILTTKQYLMYLELIAQKSFVEGSYQNGLGHLKRIETFKEELKIAEIQRELLELRELNHYGEITNNLERVEQERDKLESSNIYLIIIVVLLIVVIALSLYLFLRVRNEKTKIQSINSELTKKNDELEELAKRKNQLFNIITHDINTPLTLSNQTLKILKGSGLDGDNKSEYIDQVSDAIDRVSNLVQSVLQWLFANDGQINGDFQDFDVKELLEDALFNYEQQISTKEIELELILNKVTQKLDKVTFNIILNNIISNAIKFSSHGSIFKIELTKNSITFSNTGIAIDNKQYDEIKTIGRTYSKVGTSGEKGNGLGLSIINNLAHFNNFKFRIESKSNLTISTITF